MKAGDIFFLDTHVMLTIADAVAGKRRREKRLTGMGFSSCAVAPVLGYAALYLSRRWWYYANCVTQRA